MSIGLPEEREKRIEETKKILEGRYSKNVLVTDLSKVLNEPRTVDKNSLFIDSGTGTPYAPKDLEEIKKYMEANNLSKLDRKNFEEYKKEQDKKQGLRIQRLPYSVKRTENGKYVVVLHGKKQKVGKGELGIAKFAIQEGGQLLVAKTNYFEEELAENAQSVLRKENQFNEMISRRGMLSSHTHIKYSTSNAIGPRSEVFTKKTIFSPFIDGVAADEFLKKSAKTTADYLEFLVNLFEEVKFINDKGFVHGDLHKNNVLVSKDNKVHIIDPHDTFGGKAQIQGKRFFAEEDWENIDLDDFKQTPPEIKKGYTTLAGSDVYSLNYLTNKVIKAISKKTSINPHVQNHVQQRLTELLSMMMDPTPSKRISINDCLVDAKMLFYITAAIEGQDEKINKQLETKDLLDARAYTYAIYMLMFLQSQEPSIGASIDASIDKLITIYKQKFSSTKDLETIATKLENFDFSIFNKVNNVNLDEYPTDILKLKPGTVVAIGDLHGNAKKLLYFLVQQGVLELSEADYGRVVKIYNNPGKLSSQELIDFQDILRTAKINDNAKKMVINLIGDETGDRGKNDLLTLLILQKLHYGKVPYVIDISNHGLNLIAYREQGCNNLSEKVRDTLGNARGPGNAQPCCSLLGLAQSQTDLGIPDSSLKQLIDKCYKPHLKFISYSINKDSEPKTLNIYTHAGVGINHIQQIAEKLGIVAPSDDKGNPTEPITENVEKLTKVIDEINNKIKKLIEAGTLSKELLTELRREFNPILYNFLWQGPHLNGNGDEARSKPPGKESEWDPNWLELKDLRLKDQQGTEFKINHVFGHISGAYVTEILKPWLQEKAISHVVCLDNLVGIKIPPNEPEIATGEMSVHVAATTLELVAKEQQMYQEKAKAVAGVSTSAVASTSLLTPSAVVKKAWEEDKQSEKQQPLPEPIPQTDYEKLKQLLTNQRYKVYKEKFPRLLVEEGSQTINPNVKNNTGTPILFTAAYKGDLELVEILLRQPDINIDVTNTRTGQSVMDVVKENINIYKKDPKFKEDQKKYEKIFELLTQAKAAQAAAEVSPSLLSRAAGVQEAWGEKDTAGSSRQPLQEPSKPQTDYEKLLQEIQKKKDYDYKVNFPGLLSNGRINPNVFHNTKPKLHILSTAIGRGDEEVVKILLQQPDVKIDMGDINERTSVSGALSRLKNVAEEDKYNRIDALLKAAQAKQTATPPSDSKKETQLTPPVIMGDPSTATRSDGLSSTKSTIIAQSALPPQQQSSLHKRSAAITTAWQESSNPKESKPEVASKAAAVPIPTAKVVSKSDSKKSDLEPNKLSEPMVKKVEKMEGKSSLSVEDRLKALETTLLSQAKQQQPVEKKESTQKLTKPDPVAAPKTKDLSLITAIQNNKGTSKDIKAIERAIQTSDLNFQDKDGRTALHMALHKGDIATVKMLLEHDPKPDLTIQDNDGNTALHIAINKSYLDITKMLLIQDSSEGLLAKLNQQHKTPRDLAKTKWSKKELLPLSWDEDLRSKLFPSTSNRLSGKPN